MSLKISGSKILFTFTAGSAIAKGQVVYLSAAKTVEPATAANASKVVGVADADASAGESVDVVIYGVVSVTADAAISVGDRVIASDTTAGRVKSANTSGVSVTDAGHSHTMPKASVTAGVAALTADLGHDNTTGALETTAASSVGVTLPDTNSATTGITATFEHGRTIGIALGAAAGAGDSIDILVHKA